MQQAAAVAAATPIAGPDACSCECTVPFEPWQQEIISPSGFWFLWWLR